MYTIANYQKGNHCVDIKAVITDCDGCLTDNGVWYLESGGTARKFNLSDGHAFQLLHDKGINTTILSSSASISIRNRAMWLKTTFNTSKDKAYWLETHVRYEDLLMGNIAFMGNDTMDLAALTIVGVAACPSDAHPEIRAYVETRQEKYGVPGIVTKQKGGQAAFREFVDLLFYMDFIKS